MSTTAKLQLHFRAVWQPTLGPRRPTRLWHLPMARVRFSLLLWPGKVFVPSKADNISVWLSVETTRRRRRSRSRSGDGAGAGSEEGARTRCTCCSRARLLFFRFYDSFRWSGRLHVFAFANRFLCVLAPGNTSKKIIPPQLLELSKLPHDSVLKAYFVLPVRCCTGKYKNILLELMQSDVFSTNGNEL